MSLAFLSVLKSKAMLVQKSDGKCFLLFNGTRHYVPEPKRLSFYGINWPSDINTCSDSIINAMKVGGWLPGVFDDASQFSEIDSSLTMREFISRDLKGVGLEVGAGSSPFPIPIFCSALFGDRFTFEDLVNDMYPGQSLQDLVVPDIVTTFDKLVNVADESLDFLIACHVIEHVKDPIGALINSYRVLKKGGVLILVVPDKRKTFDRNRPLTTLDHLVLDHKHPSPDRDYQHYLEFYKLAFNVPEYDLERQSKEAFSRDGDAHFHVWTYDSFKELIDYSVSNNCNWTDVWSHPAVSDGSDDIEFYFKLTK